MPRGFVVTRTLWLPAGVLLLSALVTAGGMRLWLNARQSWGPRNAVELLGRPTVETLRDLKSGELYELQERSAVQKDHAVAGFSAPRKRAQLSDSQLRDLSRSLTSDATYHYGFASAVRFRPSAGLKLKGGERSVEIAFDPATGRLRYSTRNRFGSIITSGVADAAPGSRKLGRLIEAAGGKPFGR